MAGWDPQSIIDGRFGRRGPSAGFVLGLAGMFLAVLVALAFIALTRGTIPFVLGLVLAVLPVPALVAAVLALDRLEPEPTRRLVLAFTWGAGVAVLLAGVINSFSLVLTTDLLGRPEGMLVTATIAAPIVEELLKAAVLFGFLWFARREVDGPTDGIIYAAMVGLGFAMVENVLYYATATSQAGVVALVATFVVRGLVAPFAHPLFTSVAGMALGYAAIKRSTAVRVVVPILGLLGAIVLHGLWNAAASTNPLLLGFLYVAILAPILLGVVVVTFVERGRLVRLIGRHLPRYGELGLVAPEDLQMLAKLSRRRQARAWARVTRGPVAGQAMRDYQLAATELALLDDRVDRGVADPEHARRRREALMRLMGAAREAFLRPVSGYTGSARPPWVTSS